MLRIATNLLDVPVEIISLKEEGQHVAGGKANNGREPAGFPYAQPFVQWLTDITTGAEALPRTGEKDPARSACSE